MGAQRSPASYFTIGAVAAIGVAIALKLVDNESGVDVVGILGVMLGGGVVLGAYWLLFGRR